MLETTIAGSLPKPAWLAKPRMLWAPWRLEGEALVEAKRDATLLALKEQEDAGIDILTDGEQARQHFVHGFLEHIEGVDFARRVTMGIRNHRCVARQPENVEDLIEPSFLDLTFSRAFQNFRGSDGEFLPVPANQAR